ncbi:MAG: serine hydrolase [bacterium]|nr:serine hydrolase [bacterium]
MNKNNFLAITVAALFAILLFTPSNSEQFNKQLPAFPSPATIEILSLPDIEAQSALAYDFSSEKIIFEKNKEDVRPLASLTKVVSMLTILKELNTEEEVEISKRAILTEGPSGLLVGEHFRVRDLLAFVMVESSNDAVEALVEHLAKKNGVAAEAADAWFLNLMRDEAQSLGAGTMMFYNPTGLDIGLEAGAYGSTEDLINIIKSSLGSELWQFGSVTEVASQGGKIHKLKPTNLLQGDLNLLIGAKTGSTDLAGGNLLVIVQYPLGHPIGIVVLGSTDDGRFSDVKAIFEWVKNNPL